MPPHPQGSENVVRAVIHSCCFHEVICGLLPAGGWGKWGRPGGMGQAGPPSPWQAGGQAGRQEGARSISATISLPREVIALRFL